MQVDEVPNYVWAPFPGKQTEFLAAGEFEVLFGGAKGPGKSDCILMGATRQVHLARYKALLLRETYGELQDLIDRSHRLFPQLASKPAWSGELRRWTFPGEGIVKFHYCKTLDDVDTVQGQEWAYVGYDEAGKVAGINAIIERLIAEVRCPNPSVVWMVRLSANPGGSGHPDLKRRFVTPCGKTGERILVREVRLPNGLVSKVTRRYIPARVTDNPVYANDPLYMAQLFTLPEMLRKQLLYGDWDAGYGTALEELDERVHFKRPFPIPKNWIQFGSYDWGFAHWSVLIWWAADEDGTLWVIDTVRMRRMLVPLQAERIKSRVPVAELRYIAAGLDAFYRNRSRQDNTPTIAEEFMDYGIILNEANVDRKQGLNNGRHYVAYRGLAPGGLDADPGCYFFDTPGNRWLFEQLQSMITDEADMEDVLKVDADPITGEGGDDGYDCWRYGAASRPPRAIGSFFKGSVSAFSQQSLHWEYEHKYRDKDMPEPAQSIIIGVGDQFQGGY